MENYYAILKIPNFSDEYTIKNSYRKLLKLYHPDTNPNVDVSIIINLNRAYEILKDEKKKKEYDADLKEFLLKTNSDISDGNENLKDIFVYKSMQKRDLRQKYNFFESFLNKSLFKVYKSSDEKFDQRKKLRDIKLVKKYIESTEKQRDFLKEKMLENGLIICDEKGYIVFTEKFLNIYKMIDF